MFLSPTRQRRYCSTKCRRQVEADRAERRVQLATVLLFTCAAPRCQNVFLPHPRNPHQVYCSEACRKRAHRAASDLSAPRCANPECLKPLPETKTRRRLYCGPACRKTAWRIAQHSAETRTDA
ncbi:CGNR zinc finger domain-containing protein [Leucobacter musarum]|uniref:CGNR zinc finger domain-containing protein n=1 Tax=Leucobacter musarum TaxID=1930747 RepID=UPI00094972F2